MARRFVISPRIQRIARGVVAAIICGTGVAVFAQLTRPFYPVSEWLVWRILAVLAYALLFNAASVACGAFLLRHLIGQRELPAIERLVHAMSLGLTAFALALYAIGFVGLFNAWAALALPALFLGLGARDLRALVNELWEWRERVPLSPRVFRPLVLLVCGLGVTYLAFLYLEQLDPSAFNFDAHWYHYPLAQDYARLGRIVPFPGENHRAFPHLTSLLHTWALLVPGMSVKPQHWMLSLHLEYSLVLWRIVSVAALARWILGGRDVRGLWVGFFLFPSVFAADQAIGGSADHVLGFFAGPIALAGARALAAFDMRFCVLLGAALGGHTLVKYQAVYLLVAMAVVVTLRALFLLARNFVRARREPALAGPSPRVVLSGATAIMLTIAAVSAPHFVKNVVFYGNPVYPFLQSTFEHSHPKRTPGYYSEAAGTDEFSPKYSGLKRQAWVAGKLFQYSFVTGNRDFTRHRPYMGSLFSLLLPCVLLVPSRRLLFVLAPGLLAFWVWANTAASDRYLLSFYDLFIAITLALIVLVWELGPIARLGLVPLVIFQLFWGGDAMFLYGHRRLEASIALLNQGWGGKFDAKRFAKKPDQEKVTKATPPDAVIFARNYKNLIGLDRMVLSDIRAAQDYISYSHVKDPRQLYEILKSRGVTHLLYPPGQRKPLRWNNIVLWDALFQHARDVRTFGTLKLGKMPKQAPPPAAPFRVVVSGPREYPVGIYRVEQLDVDERAPNLFTPPAEPEERMHPTNQGEQLANVQALVLARGKLPLLRSSSQFKDFSVVERFGGFEVYLRAPGRRSTP